MKKIQSCSIFSKLRAISLAASIWIIGNINVFASDFVFDLTPYDDEDDIAFVQVTIHQQDANTLRFTVDQLDPVYFGDLRGLFFHIDESIIDPADLTFSFVAAVENITENAITPTFASAFDLNNIEKLGKDNNIHPINPFDIGFEFGEAGINGNDDDDDDDDKKQKDDDDDKQKYDIKSITFDVSMVGGLDQMSFMPINMEYFIAARVTSVRDGKDRDDSSKLTSSGTTTVPEPESTLGLFALAFGALLWRRRRSS